MYKLYYHQNASQAHLSSTWFPAYDYCVWFWILLQIFQHTGLGNGGRLPSKPHMNYHNPLFCWWSIFFLCLYIYIYIYLHIVNLDFPSDNLEFFVQPSTVIELSCESDEKMHGLTGEQKQVTSFWVKISFRLWKLYLLL